MSKYLITGGAGFIGSNIARELVKKKHEVIVFDNLHSGNLVNLEEIKDKITFIKGDIRDREELKNACGGVDYVLHQAALRGVYQSVEDPALVNEVNTTGTLNALIAARDTGVKRFVLASSSSVYGKVPSGRNVETLTPRPESPYALTKLAGEEYCRLFYKLYGLKTISLRYFNVFGPNQSPDDPYAAVIPLFVSNALKHKSSDIHGTGKQSRDFTYVSSVVKANILSTTSKKVKFGEAYNIASGENISIADLHKEICMLLKNNTKPTFTKPRPGDIVRSCANINKANKFLSYKPATSFKKGLKVAVTWYSKQLTTTS